MVNDAQRGDLGCDWLPVDGDGPELPDQRQPLLPFGGLSADRADSRLFGGAGGEPGIAAAFVCRWQTQAVGKAVAIRSDRIGAPAADRAIPHLSQLSRIPLAYLAGLSAAVAIGGAVFGTIVPQGQAMLDAFDPYRIYADPQLVWMRILDAGVMILGVVGTLSYFHFGQPLKKLNQGDENNAPVFCRFSARLVRFSWGLPWGRSLLVCFPQLCWHLFTGLQSLVK